ncbi:hypothetical protein N658DRAFT_507527 [Parathielavia hyrcaniae]|uniref:Protein kinase domain-containing protein n=1 Tax=Parathielavia hyrcaniae TaxID=113614 RepID=A0AAN6T119_9PEZI|nr:hypothetical protein N658DRAFT_507527 [Parathielavia hyrcaniae]
MAQAPAEDAARASVPLTDANGQMQQSLWRRFFGWEKDNSADGSSEPAHKADDGLEQQRDTQNGIIRRVSRKVVPGLPRAQTFKRQRSEVRSRLEPVLPTPAERRAVSMDRRVQSSNSVPDHSDLRSSAPDFLHHRLSAPQHPPSDPMSPLEDHDFARHLDGSYVDRDPFDGPLYHTDALSRIDVQSMTTSQYDSLIESELERKWILNLSMHFRDKSKREKFFVTFRQHEHTWQRVTVSLDYRIAPESSLEADLAATHYQRDKSAKIYEAIRESLADIQFYDTVTNLKLETRDGRLHVHVTEDGNEIINYPKTQMVQHLDCKRYKAREIHFDSHMSGFVYKVRVHGQLLIKKEIPGPDTVDEFLYEINALNQLCHADNVIRFQGLVVDDSEEHVTGLLINYAARGALIDVIYDSEHSLPWPTREKWARQIIGGLSEIHEAGFVQGDFTLSNIVIDEHDDAKIIDINRRGCPIGWEPPEATPLIESNQRISMYIGVKSDLYQLGMVLWALATQEDEPDAFGRPLKIGPDVQVPAWYRRVVDTCLSVDPRNRVQAAQLLSWFPDAQDDAHHARPNGSAVSLNGDNGSRRDFFSPSGVPQIKTVHPPSDWAYVGWGSQHLSDEPFYYPSRGRSPPSPMPSNQGNYNPARYGHRAYTWSDNLNHAPTVQSVNDILTRESKGRPTTEPTTNGGALETYADGPYAQRRTAANMGKDGEYLPGRRTSLPGDHYPYSNNNNNNNNYNNKEPSEADQQDMTATWGTHPKKEGLRDERNKHDTSNTGSRSREPGRRRNTGPNSHADSGKDVTEPASTRRASRGYGHTAASRQRRVSRGRSGRSSAASVSQQGGQQVVAAVGTTPLNEDDREERTYGDGLQAQYQPRHDHHRHQEEEESYRATSPSPDLDFTTITRRPPPDDVLKGVGSAYSPALRPRDGVEGGDERRRQQHDMMIFDEDLCPELDLSLREALQVTDGKA